jgi:hypothetical protein
MEPLIAPVEESTASRMFGWLRGPLTIRDYRAAWISVIAFNTLSAFASYFAGNLISKGNAYGSLILPITFQIFQMQMDSFSIFAEGHFNRGMAHLVPLVAFYVTSVYNGFSAGYIPCSLRENSSLA